MDVKQELIDSNVCSAMASKLHEPLMKVENSKAAANLHIYQEYIEGTIDTITHLGRTIKNEEIYIKDETFDTCPASESFVEHSFLPNACENRAEDVKQELMKFNDNQAVATLHILQKNIEAHEGTTIKNDQMHIKDEMCATGAASESFVRHMRLIELVKKYPCLYYLSTEEYRNIDRKELAWKEISEQLKGDCHEIKKEWKLLRDSHRNAMNRRKTKSGQAAKNAKPWKYEKQMSFLLPFNTGKLSHTNIAPPEEEQDSEIEDNSFGSAPKQSPSASSNSPILEVNSMGDEGNQSGALLQFQSRKRKSGRACGQVTDYFKYKNEKKVASDLELFFASVCESTQRLPRMKQIQVKRKIMDLIATAEEEVLYEQTPSSSSTEHYVPTS